MNVFRRILFTLLLAQLSFVYEAAAASEEAGVWVKSLCIEGIGDLNPIHLTMAKREEEVTEGLITLQEFEGPDAKTLHVFVQDPEDPEKKPRSGRFNSAGVLQDTDEDFSELVGKLQPKNICLASLCALSAGSLVSSVDISKPYRYRLRIQGGGAVEGKKEYLKFRADVTKFPDTGLGETRRDLLKALQAKIAADNDLDYKEKNKFLVVKSKDIFLARGTELSAFIPRAGESAGESLAMYPDIFPSADLSDMAIDLGAREYIATSNGLLPADIAADRKPKTLRMDSEEELLMYLASPREKVTAAEGTPTTYTEKYEVFKRHLEDLKASLKGAASPITHVSLSIHSRLDACPVCLYKLHDAYKKFSEQVRNVMGEGVKFLITFSSRDSYPHDGKARRRFGAWTDLTADSLKGLIEGHMVIQNVIDPSSLYATPA